MTYPTSYITYIDNLVNILKGYFNLQDYAISIDLMKKPDRTSYGEILASIVADPRYYNARIYVYPPVFHDFTDKNYAKVARTLVHEFCHILYQPIYNRFSKNISEAEDVEIENLFEQQVQRTANIIFQALPPSFYTPTLIKPKSNAKSRTRVKRPRPSKST